MQIAWKVLATLAAIIHVLFFLMESVFFARPAVYERFHLDAASAEVVRVWALNQGAYNLLLAAGCLAGVVLAHRGRASGRTLVAYTCLCMVGAGLVLVGSTDKVPAACLQAGPPLLALLALWRTDGPHRIPETD